MKKLFFLLSLLFMTAWIAFTFFIKSSPIIHVLFILSIILYIQSLLTVNRLKTNIYQEK